MPDSLFDVKDEKLYEMQTVGIVAQSQSGRSKLPPIISDVASVAVFYFEKRSDVPFALQSKVDKALDVFTSSGALAHLTKFSKFLRRTATHSPFTLMGGLKTGDECFEVAFGLP